MVRSAAKNHERVAVVVDPADYAAVLAELDARRRGLGDAPRFALARKAFAHTAAYDGAIAAYLSSVDDAVADARDTEPTFRELPDTLGVQWRGSRAALRREPAPDGGVLRELDRRCRARSARRIATRRGAAGQGALVQQPRSTSTRRWASALEFAEPAASIVKHTNPCGVGDRRRASPTPTSARARPIRRRAFGGIVAFNRAVDEAARERSSRRSSSASIAPGVLEPRRATCSRRRRTCACVAAHGSWAAPTDEPRGRAAQRRRRPRSCRRVDRRHGRPRGREGRDQARADRRRSCADLAFAWRVAQARQVERDRVREGRRARVGDRRRPDEPRRLGAHLRAQGAATTLDGRGRRVGRVLPVPRRPRRGSPRRARPRSSSPAARCATTR